MFGVHIKSDFRQGGFIYFFSYFIGVCPPLL
jgi:hypothetical protein